MVGGHTGLDIILKDNEISRVYLFALLRAPVPVSNNSTWDQEAGGTVTHAQCRQECSASPR